MGGWKATQPIFGPCTFIRQVITYFLSLFEASSKSEDEFYMCPGGSTIPKNYLCDGYKDCRDNSDELNCLAGKSKLNTHKSLNISFNCV